MSEHMTDENLARWKAEAMPVLDGLQELGKALDLPLGEQITGSAALEAVEKLKADARNWHVQYEHMKAERDKAVAALAEAGQEALTDALHPEFGTEWSEPDGIIYKAVQEARLEGRREAARSRWQERCTE